MLAAPPPPPPAIAQTLDQARALGRAGSLAEAERLYRGVLAADRACVQAAVALARLLTGSGRAAEA
ncbi:MAG: hypothetical protein ACREEO_11045, partial [Phenylobacterium sp.]